MRGSWEIWGWEITLHESIDSAQCAPHELAFSREPPTNNNMACHHQTHQATHYKTCHSHLQSCCKCISFFRALSELLCFCSTPSYHCLFFLVKKNNTRPRATVYIHCLVIVLWGNGHQIKCMCLSTGRGPDFKGTFSCSGFYELCFFSSKWLIFGYVCGEEPPICASDQHCSLQVSIVLLRHWINKQKSFPILQCVLLKRSFGQPPCTFVPPPPHNNSLFVL